MNRFFRGILLFLFLCTTNTVVAEKLSLYHRQPSPEALSPAGSDLTLYVVLTHSRNTGFPLQTIAVIDGQLINLPETTAILNDYEQPLYEVSLPSPLEEVRYQFFLETPEGPIASEAYALQRSCKPRLSLTETSSQKDLQGKKLIKTLANQAQSLEEDIQAYTIAQQRLEQIKELLEK